MRGAVFIFILLLTAAGPPHAQTASTNSPKIDEVRYSFVNADIDGVARSLGKLLNRSVVVDPRVKGQLTLELRPGTRPRQALEEFRAALRVLGFSVLDDGGVFKVVPEAVARILGDGLIGISEPIPNSETIYTKVFQLESIKADDVLPVVRPLISPTNTINVSPGANALIVTDYATNLRKVQRVIDQLDRIEPWKNEVIQIQHVTADELARSIENLLLVDSKTPPGKRGDVGSNRDKIALLSDERTNSLVLRYRSTVLRQSVLDLIKKFDQEIPVADGFRVFRLKNARADELMESLSKLFLGGGGAEAVAKSDGGRTSSRPIQDVRFSVDASTNSILVSGPPTVLRAVDRAIQSLDSERVQVLVESLIAEVRTDKAKEFGFQWQFPLGQSGDGLIGLLGTNFDSGGNNILTLSGQAGQVAPGAGINLGLLTSQNNRYVLGALARFLEENGVANILATPTLLTVDNREAKIVIGQNVPFVTGQYTSTNQSANAVNPFQTIERRDVGLTLRVRTQIGKDGQIRLEIYQEASNVSATNPAGLITNKRSIESSVVVQDGQIVVLGGLTQDEVTNAKEGVPGISDLPIVGALFQREKSARIKSNLMVFIRPQIVANPQAARSVSLSRYGRLRASQAETTPAPKDAVIPEYDGAPPQP